MMKTYTITGMTCTGCVAKVKRSLENIDGIQKAEIQLEHPQAILFPEEHRLPIEALRDAVTQAGNYTLSEVVPESLKADILPEKSLNTYKPLLIIVAFIAGVTLLTQYPFSDFSVALWMRHFMAGFFIVFSFFKLLNIKGFADSYQMYDIVAARWKGWGYVYPFVELALGLLYLTNIAPCPVNMATVIILGISSIGVIKSNLDKKKIKCACLGDVFKLPMSTVTIVEDLTMVAMAVFMLI